MTDLERTVRTIEEMLPRLSTSRLQKWKGILTTALIKINRELEAVQEHTCSICLFKEYGYRDELPVGWHKKGDSIICFNHEDAEIKAKQKPVDTKKTLEELMTLI